MALCSWVTIKSSFFMEITCWAPWILQIQSTGLPSIILQHKPCLRYWPSKNLFLQFCVQEDDHDGAGIVAHFPAHAGQPLSAMSFDPRYKSPSHPSCEENFKKAAIVPKKTVERGGGQKMHVNYSLPFNLHSCLNPVCCLTQRLCAPWVHRLCRL